MKNCLFMLLLVPCLFVSSIAHEDTGIVVEKLAQSTRSWNGSELPQIFDAPTQVTMLRITIPAGTSLPMHQHPVINAGILLEGQLTVKTTEGDTLHMKAGDPIIEVSNQWHYGKNEGDSPAVIFVVYVGPENEPLSVME